jgi:hypothetical protein
MRSYTEGEWGRINDTRRQIVEKSIKNPIDLQSLGIGNIFDEQFKDKLYAHYDSFCDRVHFYPPSEIYGYVRMVSDSELNYIRTGSEIRQYEYMIIEAPKKGETLIDLVPTIIRKRIKNRFSDNYTHLIFIPREEFAQFDCSLTIHPSFRPEFPAVVIDNHKQYINNPQGGVINKWKWKNVKYSDLTNQC